MHNFLVTYKKDNNFSYAWFETKEEMDDFIETEYEIEIEEAVELVVVNTFYD